MRLLRRRPVLRAAAIGGGAYYAGKLRQEAYERGRTQESASLVPPTPELSTEAIEKLEGLGRLHAQGVITDEELAAQKVRLLGGWPGTD